MSQFRRAAARVVPLALMAATSPALAGIVFREVETIESAIPSGSVRQVRQAFADGDNCKVVIEESSDPLAPPGSYILATRDDAFIVDPAGRTVAPFDPSDMEPIAQDAGARRPDRQAPGVTLERQLEEPGPPILGLPTRHFVYLLRYQPGPVNASPADTAVARPEVRFEFWETPVPPGEQVPGACQALRSKEDAGQGPARRELRDAIGQLYEQGLVLKQIIERSGGRVVREVTALSHERIAPEVFQRPTGFSQTEILAPEPNDGADQ